jgi:hypothetical protein
MIAKQNRKPIVFVLRIITLCVVVMAKRIVMLAELLVQVSKNIHRVSVVNNRVATILNLHQPLRQRMGIKQATATIV